MSILQTLVTMGWFAGAVIFAMMAAFSSPTPEDRTSRSLVSLAFLAIAVVLRVWRV